MKDKDEQELAIKDMVVKLINIPGASNDFKLGIVAALGAVASAQGDVASFDESVEVLVSIQTDKVLGFQQDTSSLTRGIAEAIGIPDDMLHAAGEEVSRKLAEKYGKRKSPAEDVDYGDSE